MKDFKRITLLCGHYGSGKTNVAVNMALMLKKQRDNVAIADLDIVNPYFRTKDSSKEFENCGIRLIASSFANSNVDIPALPQDMYAITDDKALSVIIDVGGDDRGALALGRLAPQIVEENDYEMLMVINCYRPLTRDALSTIEVMREIEYAGHIKFTGLVNNSNLGVMTTPDDVISSLSYADEVSKLSNLPVVCTTVEKSLYNDLSDKIENLLPLSLQARPV
ncbi:MAG: hypothetical protein IJD68_02860 [Ruminococcus sp.]|nr:hypothetical protein [Ruminococcus sp.]